MIETTTQRPSRADLVRARAELHRTYERLERAHDAYNVARDTATLTGDPADLRHASVLLLRYQTARDKFRAAKADAARKGAAL